MIKQHSVDKVIETARIEEVVDEFVHLKKAGVNFKGNCPFHNEKTPSFVVSPAKNIYKCFGCGKGGNPVQFMMEHEKLSFIEAIRWLAAKYNIELEETERTDEEMARIDARESLFIVNEFSKSHFSENLFESNEGKSVGMSYFKERGFYESTIKKFGLGYAVRDRSDLYEALKSKQYNIEVATKLGVVKENRDFFNARVMFSIHNLSGKVIGFGGRTLSKEKKIPKYINSPESEIYNKRKTLYGLYHAKNDIRKKDECILVEGYTDVITLHQSGLENVVAASGTSLTEDQIRLIKRYSPNIKVLFDGDNAGVKAALRGMDMILAQDMNVKLVLLPEGEDPDSYLKKVGVDQFRTYAETEAKDFIQFKTEMLMAETANDPIQKSIAVKSIIESISKIPDTLKRSLYIKQYSSILELDESILHRESNELIKGEMKKERYKSKSYRDEQYDEPPFPGERREHAPQKSIKERNYESDEHQEKELIRILINFANKPVNADSEATILEFIFENVSDILERIENPVYKALLEECRSESEKGTVIDVNYFINHMNPEIQQLAIDCISSPYIYANWSEKGLELQTQKPPDDNQELDAEQVIMRLRERKLRKSVKEIKAEILKMDTEDTNYILYLKAFNKIEREHKELLRELGTVIS
ncbi:DNA primase [Portibacter lacus]|uniref:DNA primase n=1 Tax=Portibacter lacus TaxID=1099794 RepID=A0AA37SLK9_9BACT|nr:DNA primase [Portibacter lacus]GLR16501.1 DNA primase [Portibacter lacus]